MNARIAIVFVTLLLAGSGAATGQERSHVSIHGAAGWLVNVQGRLLMEVAPR